MCKKTLFLLAVLGLFWATAVQAANVTVVTEDVDREPDGVQDDQGLIDWLVAQGHTVDVQRNYWTELDDAKLAALNAADLVIVSRTSNSGNYDDGDEPTQWNSVTTPMIQMSAYLVRNSRWKWMDSGTATNNTTDTIMEVLEPDHAVFAGVTLTSADPNDPNAPANLVQAIDPNVGTGITSFIDTLDAGNGTLLAIAPTAGMAWIAEWDKGVEFYDGAGQFAGGPRMFFAGGTQESGETPQGAWNFTADGEIMFGNAVNYMLSIPARYASMPTPADGASGLPYEQVVLSWTAGTTAASHDVYFGTSAEAVASASTDVNDSMDVLVSVGQEGTSFDPGNLEFGTTYYWRVDEVGAAPDFKTYKGEVWSFTVETYTEIIENVTASASSSESDLFGPEKTVDGSGLDDNDLHSTNGTAMWLSSGTPDEVVYIEYAFDKPYRLGTAWVWNSNTAIEKTYGYGLKDVTIETSMDGTTWTTLGDVEFAQAPGTNGYAHDTVDMGGTIAMYVRFVANSNWGGGPRYGLSEVRFVAITGPAAASQPQPASGATDVAVNATLHWRPDMYAISHQLYLSTDKAAVEDGTALVGETETNSFDLSPLGLNIGTTYYWKVNEIHGPNDPEPLEAEVWSFTTENYFDVDNFENYTSADITKTWVDNWKRTVGKTSIYPSTGSPVIDSEGAYSGSQSFFLAYDNAKSPYHAEYWRSISGRTNWTANGVKQLVIAFKGDPGNFSGDKLSATINNKKIVYSGDISQPWWKLWVIDLASAGINAKDIQGLAIGVGDNPLPAGKKGKVWIDAIRLYRSAPTLPNIVDAAVAVNTSGDMAGQFDTLLAALEAADPAILDELSSEEDYTVFAPTDDAFAALGITAGNVGNLDTAVLNEVLLYHIAKGKLTASDVLATSEISTIEGASIAQADGVLTDGIGRQANLVAVDGEALNGVIHVVDTVLLPFEIRNIVEMLNATNTAGDLAGQLDDIIGLIQGDPSVMALLTGPDQYTLFAPTDAAIEVLRANADDNLLKYHIAAGSLLAADVLAAEQIEMLNGGTLTQVGGVLIDAAGRQAMLVATDIVASNGVIHVIDAVLLPVPVIDQSSLELAGGDPAVTQMTPLILQEGDLFTLKLDAAKTTWTATTLRMSLYYMDADGMPATAVTADVALTAGTQEYTLELNAYEVPEAVGKTIGIALENISMYASAAATIDNLRLEGPAVAPEPEPEPEPEPAVEPEPEPVVEPEPEPAV